MSNDSKYCIVKSKTMEYDDVNYLILKASQSEIFYDDSSHIKVHNPSTGRLHECVGVYSTWKECKEACDKLNSKRS